MASARSDTDNFKTARALRGLPSSQVGPAIATLSQKMTPVRLQRLHSVLEQRTDCLRFVFENPSNVNNCWAALRSMDSLGLQYADIIMCAEKYSDEQRRQAMRLSLGTQKWMTLEEHTSTTACITSLQKQGYAVYVTDIHHPNSLPLSEVDLKGVLLRSRQDPRVESKKLAILLGNEKAGISEEARASADGHFYLPMRGFAESLNVSAFCALLCGHLLCDAHIDTPAQSQGWADAEERQRVLLGWLAADSSEEDVRGVLN